jgi:hypothetical protein
MVALLPEVPSFGTQFARNLGGGFTQGLSRSAEFSQEMALQKQKQEQQQSFFKNLQGNKAPSSGDQLSGPKEEFQLSPEQETMLALTDPPAFNAYKHLKEERAKEKDISQRQSNLKGALSEMVQTLLKNNLGYTARRATAEGRRDAQYFDTLGVQLESIGKEMVSKGVLSAPRFAYLLSNLPSANKTDASNAGALEAWHKELGLEVPEELKSLYESKSKKKASKKPKTIEMFDEEGNTYDIPVEHQEHAFQKGLRAE